MIAFTVLGLPQAAGSKRHVGNGRIIDSNPKAREWKNMVADAALQETGWSLADVAAGRDPVLLDGPLAVRFIFHLPRPKGHFLASRELNAQGRRQYAPTVRPDVLKLARAVEDALTGVVWRDDAQIVSEWIQKRYGEPARVEIEIGTEDA
jgi:Holliday junction resolvase RusA-like endonuclease